MPDYSNSLGTGVVEADIFKVGGIAAPKVVLSGVITFAPPSLATGVFATSSPITIAGVALGDTVDLYPPYDTQGIIYQGTAQAADKITINLFNANSATKALASGSWGYAVRRRV